MYSRVPPPPPPAGGSVEDNDYPMEEGLVTVPLTRENITLLQALSQPSRLRRRVAPNFETISWNDPDHMQYNLSGYRPSLSEDAAQGTGAGGARKFDTHALPRTAAKDTPRGERDDSGSSSRRGRGNAPAKYNVDAGRPQKYQEYPSDGERQREVDSAKQGGRGGRQLPARPSAPLPSSCANEPSSTGSGAGLRTRLPNDDDAESDSDMDYGTGRNEPSKTGGLNVRAVADQFNRANEARLSPPMGTREKGTTRQEVLPSNDIYASRDSDDASYQKRPAEAPTSYGAGQRESSGLDENDNLYPDPDENVNDNSIHPRPPLRDTWERPYSDDSDEPPRRGYNGTDDNDDNHKYPPYSADEDRPSYGEEEKYLRGEVTSYDDEVMAVPSNRNQPRRPLAPPPQSASRPNRRAAPLAREQTNSKNPQAYATRQEVTTTYRKTKQHKSRHNPKAFRNKTTHSWISTNTTTTVILPAATVQLVPLSGFAPVVEEVPMEGQWASQPPYRLNAPQMGNTHTAAGYPHQPSQMIVLDDSEDVAAAANNTRGRAATSLPPLQRRAYDSANNAALYDSMPEL